VDAPPGSCLANAGAADSGVTADDIQAVMIGIARWLARPRVVAAGGDILAVLVFEIMVAEAGAEQDAGAGQGARAPCRHLGGQPGRRLLPPIWWPGRSTG